MKLILRDLNTELCQCWAESFEGIPDVEISCGNFFEQEADCIISPANSFGYMDGGIDLLYTQKFGWQLQNRLQDRIKLFYGSKLPIGEAILIKTRPDFEDNAPWRWMASAPTMEIPGPVPDSNNAYLALLASLKTIHLHNDAELDIIKSVMCPGLCTATGRMPAEMAAKQMFDAYQDFKEWAKT